MHRAEMIEPKPPAAPPGRPARPRALVLTPRMPWPPDDGGRIGLWQSVWGAAQAFDTVLLTFDTPEAIARPVPAPVSDLGIKVVRVPHLPSPGPAAALKGLFGPWPYTLARYQDARFEAAARRLVREWKPEIAIINHLHLAPYADALGDTPWVLREHNVEFSWMRRYANSCTNPLRRAYAGITAAKLERVESAFCKRAARVFAIQDSEAGELRRVAPGARVEIVPIGVDFRRFQERRPDAPAVVLVVGSYAWSPNLEGLRRFLDLGWPTLRALAPDARLVVVGKDLPEPFAAELRARDAVALGYVPDIGAEFARASALVVPLWVGAGARVKIVEALAAGLPVVATKLAAEGLGLRDGVHALFAEEPTGLARAVARLLAEPELARRLSAEGRDWAAAHFSLDAVARKTNQLCAEVLAEARSGS